MNVDGGTDHVSLQAFTTAPAVAYRGSGHLVWGAPRTRSSKLGQRKGLNTMRTRLKPEIPSLSYNENRTRSGLLQVLQEQRCVLVDNTVHITFSSQPQSTRLGQRSLSAHKLGWYKQPAGSNIRRNATDWRQEAQLKQLKKVCGSNTVTAGLQQTQ